MSSRVQIDHRPLLSNNVPALDYLATVLTILPFWLIIFAFLGLYSAQIYNRRLVEWSRIFGWLVHWHLLMIGWEYVTNETLFPARLVVVYVFVGAATLLIFEREIIRAGRSLLYRFGRGVRLVLVVGSSHAIADIASNLDNTKRSGATTLWQSPAQSLFPDDVRAEHFSRVEEALKAIDRLRVTTIIQTELYENEDRNQIILSAAQTRHIQYNFIPGQPEFYTGKNSVDVFLGYPMITVSQTPLIGWGEIVKRIFDTILSTLLIIILSPVFLLIILLQKSSAQDLYFTFQSG